MAYDGYRRVVVTGGGVISPVGNDLKTFWENVSQGRSGIGPVTRFDTSQYSVSIAGEVKDFDLAAYLDPKEAKRADRFAHYGVAAALEALADASLKITNENAYDIGVMIGSGIGGMGTWEREFETLLTKGPGRVSPFLVPMMICNMAAGQVAIKTGAKGPNAALVTACASAGHAIGDATEIIRRGHAVAMIAGGAEAPITPSAFAGFASAKALSRRNEEPEKASRPFDAERDGFVISEGAGVVILEELDHALRRGAHIYGEIIGYGMSGDAFHQTAPCTHGAVAAMRRALQDAGLRPEQVDYINAHGTSTPAGDACESEAVKQIWGEAAYQVPVSSTKSVMGHLLGAAGGVELIACLLAIRDQILPPTINYETPDPACDLDYVPNQPRAASLEVAMSNSFGFGGHNATLIVRRFGQ